MKKYLALLVLIAASLAFFYQTFTKGLLPVPTDTLIGLYHPWLDAAAKDYPAGVPFKNFLITDPIRQQIPWRKLVIDSVKQGSMPLWNPYNFSGTPLLANIQAGWLYPLNVLFFVFPFAAAWTWLIILQPVLAGLFLFLFLRNKKLSPWSSAIGGITWAFSGFSVAWLTWGTIVQTALWLPLILLCIDKVAETDRKFRWSVLLALSLSFAFFAGHAQVALYTFIFAAAYAALRFSWQLVAAGLAAGIATSLEWVPMLQFLGRSARLGDAAAWTRDGWFLPWQHLAQFIAPDFFGNPATLNYWGVWNYGEFIGYVGVLPLIFGAYALIARKDRLTRFFGVWLGIVFLFLLPTPIARLPYVWRIPYWSALQPTRLMVLVDFSLAVLAALGVDAFVRNPSKKIFVIFAALAVVLAALWTTDNPVARRNLVLPGMLLAGGAIVAALSPKQWKTVWLVGVFGFVAFDLFRFGWKFTPFTPREYFFPSTQAISFLQSQQKPFRVMSLDNRALPPDVTAYYGIETPEGYDPVYDARYEEFIAAVNRNEPNITPPFGFNRIITLSNVDSPLLPLLNVTYVAALDDVKNPNLELMYREGNTRIYFYKKALPRMWAVASVRSVSSKQELFNVLYDKKFQPRETALAEDGFTLNGSALLPDETIRITSYTGDSLTATATLREDRFVVVSNSFDPNWKVEIDGKRIAVRRVDYLFIGFVVPKGTHRITVRYAMLPL